MRGAQANGLQVLLTITGTPAWANGGQTPNHPPTDLNDLTQFAQMLATRYNGRHAGFGVVTLFSVWNEPNLGTFLTPQYQGTTIVSPSIYAKLFMAAYKGIKAGNPNAVVAAGETSNRGRNTPTGSPGEDSVAPGTFAQDSRKGRPEAAVRRLGDAPVPDQLRARPDPEGRFPERRLLDDERVRRRPADVVQAPRADLGHRVRRDDEAPVAHPRRQLREAGRRRARRRSSSPRRTPTCRCSSGSSSATAPVRTTWYSGLEKANGQKKPAYAAFASTANGMVGQTLVVKPNVRFSVTMPVPLMAVDNPSGTPIGVSYAVKHGATIVAAGQARVAISTSDTVSFSVAFDPVGYADYTMVASANDLGGQIEVHDFAVQATLGLPPPVKHK